MLVLDGDDGPGELDGRNPSVVGAVVDVEDLLHPLAGIPDPRQGGQVYRRGG